MQRFDLVMFDFDGTLADSAEWMFGVLNELADRYGFRQVTSAEIDMLRGRPNREIIAYLGVPTWQLPAIARTARERARADAIRLFRGAGETLDRLAAAGVAVAVVSSNGEDAVRRVLGSHAASVRYWACGASLFGKARKMRQVLRAAGVDPSRAAAVGDETRDIDAARAAGVTAIAVTWGYATSAALREAKADILVSGWRELELASGTTFMRPS
jgi:phosphoglycolate phosphatase